MTSYTFRHTLTHSSHSSSCSAFARLLNIQHTQQHIVCANTSCCVMFLVIFASEVHCTRRQEKDPQIHSILHNYLRKIYKRRTMLSRILRQSFASHRFHSAPSSTVSLAPHHHHRHRWWRCRRRRSGKTEPYMKAPAERPLFRSNTTPGQHSRTSHTRALQVVLFPPILCGQ